MSTFDFGDLPGVFATDGGDSGNPALPIARDGGVSFVDGIGTPIGWTAGTLSEAAVFPLNPRELEALPEGIRERGAVRVFTPTPLYGVRWGSDDDDGRRGDVIEWRGALWQVTELDDYQVAAGFSSAVAVRMDRPEATVAAFVAAEAAG